MVSPMDMAKAIATSPNVVCECGSKVFNSALVLKKISALVSPTGKEEIVDIPVFVCAKCGKIPAEIKNNRNYAKIFGEESNELNQ